MAGLIDVRAMLERERSIIVAVKVKTNAHKSEVLDVTEAGVLQIRLATIPERGKANEELRALLARFFDVPKSGVVLLSGQTSQHKRLKISK